MSIVVNSCVLLYCVCITILDTSVAGLLARSPVIRKVLRPATSAQVLLGFPVSVYMQMLRWFPKLQVATACFSCSPPDLNFLVTYFIFMYMHNNQCHRVTAQLQLINYYYYYYYYYYKPVVQPSEAQCCKVCGLPGFVFWLGRCVVCCEAFEVTHFFHVQGWRSRQNHALDCWHLP